jgi:hypothetical protein
VRACSLNNKKQTVWQQESSLYNHGLHNQCWSVIILKYEAFMAIVAPTICLVAAVSLLHLPVLLCRLCFEHVDNLGAYSPVGAAVSLENH